MVLRPEMGLIRGVYSKMLAGYNLVRPRYHNRRVVSQSGRGIQLESENRCMVSSHLLLINVVISASRG